jgi:hypothetical protein
VTALFPKAAFRLQVALWSYRIERSDDCKQSQSHGMRHSKSSLKINGHRKNKLLMKGII